MVVGAADLAFAVGDQPSEPIHAAFDSLDEEVAALERRRIVEALARTGHNHTHIARELGLSRVDRSGDQGAQGRGTWRGDAAAQERVDDDRESAAGGEAGLAAHGLRSLSGGRAKRFCTTTLRDEIFGPGEGQDNYLVRCLLNADGDGGYDHFHRYGELVFYNMRTGKSGPASGVAQTDVPLPRTLTLIALADRAAIPNAAFEPRVLRRLVIETVRDSEMVIGLAANVGILPRNTDVRRRKPQQHVTIPLRDGARGELSGWTIAVQQAKAGWMTTAQADPAAAPAELACQGSVVAHGDEYTLVTAGGSQTLTLAQVQAAAGRR